MGNPQITRKELTVCASSSFQTYVIVIVEALLDHVELPVLSGVVSYPSAVQPVAIVAADIMVDLWRKCSNNEGKRCHLCI